MYNLLELNLQPNGVFEQMWFVAKVPSLLVILTFIKQHWVVLWQCFNGNAFYVTLLQTIKKKRRRSKRKKRRKEDDLFKIALKNQLPAVTTYLSLDDLN